MTPGARAASPPTARAGWRRGWSSRTSRVLSRPGLMNVTDHDSRPVRTHGQPRCRATTPSWPSTSSRSSSPPRSRPTHRTSDTSNRWSAPPNASSRRRPRRPDVVLADAGYWHQRQIETVASDGIQVLVPPDAGLRRGARPGWTGGLYDFMRRVLATPTRPRALPPAPDHDRAGVRPDQVQPRRSDASNAAAEPPAAANGGSSPPPTTCSSSTTTASPPRQPDRGGGYPSGTSRFQADAATSRPPEDLPDSLASNATAACLRWPFRNRLALDRAGS